MGFVQVLESWKFRSWICRAWKRYGQLTICLKVLKSCGKSNVSFKIFVVVSGIVCLRTPLQHTFLLSRILWFANELLAMKVLEIFWWLKLHQCVRTTRERKKENVNFWHVVVVPFLIMLNTYVLWQEIGSCSLQDSNSEHENCRSTLSSNLRNDTI